MLDRGPIDNMKGDLAIRPVSHQDERTPIASSPSGRTARSSRRRIVFNALAPGLTARSALEKSAAVQMIDVDLPTTDGRELLCPCRTQPEPELQLPIQRLRFQLPPQPLPKITTPAVALRSADVVKTFRLSL
jgi:hypothetical protein